MKWADEKFLSALIPLSSDRLTGETGNSFKSLLDTANHIYLAEWVWLKRVHGTTDAKMADLSVPENIRALERAWPDMHRMWLDWANSFSPEEWVEALTFRNNAGIESTMPYWQIALHVVNHGSYHRGQLTTMLRQAGLNAPATDLLLFYRTR